MKNFLNLSVLSLLGFTFSGCNIDMTAKNVASLLRVDVQLKTDDYDTCAKKQLEQFGDEFPRLSADQQQRLLDQASKYQSIQIMPTQVAQTVTGQLIKLYLVERSCNMSTSCYGWRDRHGHYHESCKSVESCSKEHQEHKILFNSLVKNGPDPITNVASGSGVVLTTQKAEDQSNRERYYTYDLDLYNSISSSLDNAFIVGLQDGTIIRNDTLFLPKDPQKTKDCGKMIGLESVF